MDYRWEKTCWITAGSLEKEIRTYDFLDRRVWSMRELDHER